MRDAANKRFQPTSTPPLRSGVAAAEPGRCVALVKWLKCPPKNRVTTCGIPPQVNSIFGQHVTIYPADRATNRVNAQPRAASRLGASVCLTPN